MRGRLQIETTEDHHSVFTSPEKAATASRLATQPKTSSASTERIRAPARHGDRLSAKNEAHLFLHRHPALLLLQVHHGKQHVERVDPWIELGVFGELLPGYGRALGPIAMSFGAALLELLGEEDLAVARREHALPGGDLEVEAAGKPATAPMIQSTRNGR